MHAVKVATAAECMEDGPVNTIAVTSASQQTQSFVDEAVGCERTTYGKPATNIHPVFAALEKLAQ